MIKNFFWHLLSDKSPLNPTVAVGVGAFIMMCVFGLADVVTGILQKDLVISDTIFYALAGIVGGAFLGTGFNSAIGNKNIKDEQ